MERKMEIDYKSVGDRIRAARKRLRLTQERAAERTEITGQYWSLIETGRYRGSVNTFLQIASALDLTLDDLFYEAEDIAGEFRGYRANLTYDPQRLTEVDERLALLYRLRKKYAHSGRESGAAAAGTEAGIEEEILSYAAGAQVEIEALCGAEENRDKLKSEIQTLEKDLASRAAVLRQKRTTASTQLGSRITDILSRLGMPNARFSVAVVPKIREAQNTTGAAQITNAPLATLQPATVPSATTNAPVYGPWGTEDIDFLISANTGEPLKDLAKIASGGELSRVMLAIKTVLSGTSTVPDNSASLLPFGNTLSTDSIETMIFDEIDAGIGGEVALAVGEYLSKIGKVKQIFCVTHLASIAVRADNHFKVDKRTEGGRTFTGVGPLTADGRRREIARMLSGDAGDAALAHADDLIVKYGRRS